VGTAADSLFREGDPLPDTYLRALDDGRVQSLRSLRGRKTLLIHFASW
jgi:hypothetical protein